MSAYRRAFLGLVICNVLWGVSFPVMLLLNRLPTVQAAASAAGSAVVTSAAYLLVRFLMAVVLMVIFLPKVSRRLTREELKAGLGVGVLFSAGMVLQVLGLYDIAASRSAFLTSLSVVFAPLAMVVMERKPPRAVVLLGSALALFGTAVLTDVCAIDPARLTMRINFSAVSWGDVATTVAALFFTFSIVAVDRASLTVTPVRITVGMFLGVFLMTAAVLAGFAAIWGTAGYDLLAAQLLDTKFLVMTACLTVGCTIVPFVLMNHYQHYFSPAHASVIYTLEPVFATIWASFLPDLISPLAGVDYHSEIITAATIVGGVFIGLGNIVALTASEQHNARDHSTPCTAELSAASLIES